MAFLNSDTGAPWQSAAVGLARSFGNRLGFGFAFLQVNCVPFSPSFAGKQFYSLPFSLQLWDLISIIEHLGDCYCTPRELIAKVCTKLASQNGRHPLPARHVILPVLAILLTTVTNYFHYYYFFLASFFLSHV